LGAGSGEAMTALAERAVREALSVRQVEEAVRGPVPAPARSGPRASAGRKAKDVHDRAAERRLEQRFGTRAVIRRARRGGRIEIAFYSEEELQRLFEMLVQEA